MNRYLVNVVILYGCKIINGFSQLLSLKLLADFFSVDELAAYFLVFSFAPWMVFLQLGYGPYFQNIFTKALAKKRDIGFINYSLKIIQVRLLCFSLFYALIVSIVFFSFYLGKIENSYAYILFSMCLIWGVKSALSLSYYIFNARFKGSYLSIHQALSSLISLFIIYIVLDYVHLASYLKISIALMSLAIPELVLAIFCFLYTQRWARHVSSRKDVFSLNGFHVSRKPLLFFYYGVFCHLLIGFDVQLLTYFSSSYEVIQYGFMSRIYNALYFLLFSLITLYWPYVTFAISRQDTQFVERGAMILCAVCIFAIVAFTILFYLNSSLLYEIFFSKSIEVDGFSIALMGLYYAVRVVVDLSVMILVASGRVRSVLKYLPFQVVFGLSLQIILVSYYGLTGLILALIIQFVFFGFWINPLIYYKYVRSRSP